MSHTMRAAVIDVDRTIRLVDDQPRPTPSEGEVLVQSHRVGVCGTDVGYFTGEREVPRDGWILGHEGTGVIHDVGRGIDPGLVGTRIAVEPNFPCDACDMCARGQTALCQARGSLALNRPGLFAEFAVVPAAYCWEIPAELDDNLAVIVEPAAVCLAAIRRAGILDHAAGQGVVVVGAGALGLLLVEMLRVLGCDVSVLELDSRRRERALVSGSVTAAHRDGRTRYEVAFDTTGTSSGGLAALDRVAVGGKLVVVGVGNDPIPLDTRVLVRRGLQIQGSMIYDHPLDFRATVQFLTTQSIVVGRCIGSRYRLDELEHAFREHHTAVGKTVIEIGEVNAA